MGLKKNSLIHIVELFMIWNLKKIITCTFSETKKKYLILIVYSVMEALFTKIIFFVVYDYE